MVAAGEQEEKDRGEYEHEEVDCLEAVWGDGAKDGDWQPHDDAYIEDIAADNIAHDEIGLFAASGNDGGD